MSEWQPKIGERVRMTQAGIEQGLARRGKVTGVVVGLTASPLGVRILRDGIKTPSRYHRRFWEPTHDR